MEAAGASDAVFRVRLSEAAPPPVTVEWTHDFLEPQGNLVTLTCERTTTGYRMHFPGVATLIAAANGELCVHPHAGMCRESVRHVLLDQALPRLMAQRGELVLHAALVRTLAGRNLLLIGDSGRGKSTLTGACFASGRVVATDDGAVLRVTDGTLVAVPNYPSLRLLPDSLSKLFQGRQYASLPVANYSQKRRLPVNALEGSAEVHAILILDPPSEDGTAPHLARKTPAAACHALMRHGFQLDLSDVSNHQRLLAKGAQAAQLAPVYSLAYPRRYEALPEVLALLEGLA